MARSATAYDFEYFQGTRDTRSARIAAESSYARRAVVQDKAAVKQKPKTRVFRTVLIVALFIASAMLMLYSNVSINETDVEINEATKQVFDLKSKNQKLDMKLSQTFSPSNIELIATTELGMVRAQVANVEYFSVSSGNVVSVKSKDEGVFDRFLRLF
jgi:Septum formation initiator.